MRSFLILLFLTSGCATIHQSTTYSCRLTAAECRLVDSAAYWATQEGYLTQRDDTDGVLEVVPAHGRTIFFTKMVPSVNHVALVAPALIPGGPPLMERHGVVIEVHALRGGMVRDG